MSGPPVLVANQTTGVPVLSNPVSPPDFLSTTMRAIAAAGGIRHMFGTTIGVPAAAESKFTVGLSCLRIPGVVWKRSASFSSTDA